MKSIWWNYYKSLGIPMSQKKGDNNSFDVIFFLPIRRHFTPHDEEFSLFQRSS